MKANKTYKVKKGSMFELALKEALEDQKIIIDCIKNKKEYPERIKKKLKTF